MSSPYTPLAVNNLFASGEPSLRIQLGIAQNGDSVSCVKLANLTTKLKVLSILSKSKFKSVRKEVAFNHYIDKRIFETLVEEFREDYVSSLLNDRKPNYSIPALEYLSENRDPFVRFDVASLENIPVYLLEKLAGDPTDMVRSAVAKNVNTPYEIREIYIQYVKQKKKENFLANKSFKRPPTQFGDIKDKTNSDLELLLKLKGYLKNA